MTKTQQLICFFSLYGAGIVVFTCLFLILYTAIDVGKLTDLEQLVNDTRASYDKPALVHNKMLAGYAMERCITLRDSHTFTHDNWLKPWNEHFNLFSKKAENLAEHYRSDKGTVNGWLSSEKHRNTMLGDYQYVGTAECGNPIDGTLTVQLFAN